MKQTIEVGRARMTVEDFSPPQPPASASPLVLLHGFTGTRETWRELAPALQARGRSLLAFDLPGHGETRVGDRVDDHDATATTRLLLGALDVLRIERIALVGYSLGGRLALATALAAPERIERLVLVSASPGIESAAERAARRGADEALAESIESHGVEAFVDCWQELPLFAGLERLDPARRAWIRTIRLQQRAAGLAASLRAAGAGVQPWLGDRLGELSMPVLLVTGREDAKFTALAKTMARRIPDVELAIVQRTGHTPHIERPDAFLRAVGSFVATPAGRIASVLNPQESP